MKRLIVAVAIALSTAPAFAEHRDSPFEQTELDRALPAVPESGPAYEPISREGMPFEQAQLDRALPGVADTSENVLVAQIGSMSYKDGSESESPWATDHNFIAPAQ